MKKKRTMHYVILLLFLSFFVSCSAPGPAPMTGRVIRVNKDKTRDIVVDNLFFPTAMTFGPGGALYISNMGFGPPTGQILKVVFNSN